MIARAESMIHKRKRGETTDVMKHWKSTGIASKGGVSREQNPQLWLGRLTQLGELKPGQVVDLGSVHERAQSLPHAVISAWSSRGEHVCMCCARLQRTRSRH
jgi:hypothetical protein